MTADEVRALVLRLPETAEGTSYGHPSYKLRGKFFTRLRAEDDSLVIYVDSLDQRDMLIEAEPATFHLTDHYRSHPIVLARIASVDPTWLKSALENHWRRRSPKRAVSAWEACRE